MLPNKYCEFFEISFKEAESGSKKKHGGPFGAVVIQKNKVISKAHNTVLLTNDPSCHAEINAIRKACKKLGRPHLQDCILIASSEPCPMCFTTASWANIGKIYYAVPRKIAAAAGFKDDFIYKDLKKPLEKRKTAVIYVPVFRKTGEAIFRQWKKQGGKLY